MHRTIVESIKKSLENYIKQDLLIVFVNNKPTNGLWGMQIVVKQSHVYLLKQIERTGMEIGRLNGECLFCTIWENSIKFT
jgi:hypothetical protein